MYKLSKDPFTHQENAVVRLSDNTFIPYVRTLPEYEEYLKWLAEGNTPLPAENT
jgi:hypothetical protein